MSPVMWSERLWNFLCAVSSFREYLTYREIFRHVAETWWTSNMIVWWKMACDLDSHYKVRIRPIISSYCWYQTVAVLTLRVLVQMKRRSLRSCVHGPTSRSATSEPPTVTVRTLLYIVSQLYSGAICNYELLVYHSIYWQMERNSELSQ